MAHNERGQEIPDPTPVAMPINFRRPESLVDMMRRLIRTEVSQHAESLEAESFEEANDFDVDEENIEDRNTPYQDMGSDEELQDATPEGKEPSVAAPAAEQPPATPAVPAQSTAPAPVAANKG